MAPGRQQQRGRFEKPKDSKKTLSRLLSYLKPYRWKVIAVYGMMTIASLGMVLSSYLLKPIINDYILPGDFTGLFRMLVLLGGIVLLTSLLSYVYRKMMIKISLEVIYSIRNQLFGHMQSLPLSFFDEGSQGELMSRFTNDVDNLNEALSNSMLNLLSSFLTLGGTVLAMFLLSPQLFIITLITLLVMVYLAKKIGSTSKKYFSEQQKKLGSLNGYIEEMVKWQKVIKVFQYEDRAIERFGEKNDELRNVQYRAQASAMSMMPTMMNLSQISYAVISIFGGIFAVRGLYDIGTLVAYLQYSRQFSGPIGNATENINSIFSAMAGAERVFQLLDQQPEVDEGSIQLVRVREAGGELTVCDDIHCLRWAWQDPDTGALTPLCGRIAFENVSFSYTPGVPILKDITFYVEPGQKVAFVGSTGAGKTTIMNLITRFYEIDEGVITYDNIDIRKIRKEDLRQAFGIVLQDVNLFSGTIEDNIRYGRPKASLEEIQRASELSNAATFISHLPDGINTEISGGGSDLSQGERQLLSIARAAITNPPALILDEATSSIDTRTERIVQEGMFNLMEGRTVLVIAHRLSTIYDSDCIFVMENGEIIERGPHDHLINERGRYYNLYTGRATLT